MAWLPAYRCWDPSKIHATVGFTSKHTWLAAGLTKCSSSSLDASSSSKTCLPVGARDVLYRLRYDACWPLRSNIPCMEFEPTWTRFWWFQGLHRFLFDGWRIGRLDTDRRSLARVCALFPPRFWHCPHRWLNLWQRFLGSWEGCRCCYRPRPAPTGWLQHRPVSDRVRLLRGLPLGPALNATERLCLLGICPSTRKQRCGLGVIQICQDGNVLRAGGRCGQRSPWHTQRCASGPTDSAQHRSSPMSPFARQAPLHTRAVR